MIRTLSIVLAFVLVGLAVRGALVPPAETCAVCIGNPCGSSAECAPGCVCAGRNVGRCVEGR